MKLQSKLRTFSMVFALIAIWVVAGYVTGGAFLQPRNLSNLFRQMAVTGILAVGMVFIIVARHIDLSIGSVVCFLGAVAAILNTNHNIDPTLTFFITVAVGLIIGSAQGYLTAYQNIPSFIVSLGGMMGFRGASMWITSNVTIPLNENWILKMGTSYLSAWIGWLICGIGFLFLLMSLFLESRSKSAYGLEPTPKAQIAGKVILIAAIVFGAMRVFSSYEGIPTPVLILAALVIIFSMVSTKTVWGRHIYAIGGNIEAAKLSGVPVKLRTLSVFVLMGFLSAIAGLVLTARVGSASPDAGQLLELDAIASCVIGGTSLMGGKGTVLGAILGALVMESLNNGMSMANVEPFWQYMVKGLVLVVAVWVDMLSQSKEA